MRTEMKIRVYTFDTPLADMPSGVEVIEGTPEQCERRLNDLAASVGSVQCELIAA